MHLLAKLYSLEDALRLYPIPHSDSTNRGQNISQDGAKNGGGQSQRSPHYLDVAALVLCACTRTCRVIRPRKQTGIDENTQKCAQQRVCLADIGLLDWLLLGRDVLDGRVSPFSSSPEKRRARRGVGGWGWAAMM